MTTPRAEKGNAPGGRSPEASSEANPFGKASDMDDLTPIILLAVLAKASDDALSPDKPYEAFDLLNKVSSIAPPSLYPLVTSICWAVRTAAASTVLSIAKGKHPDPTESTVYFAEKSDGLIKIGFAQDVEARMRQISGMAGSDLSILVTTNGGSIEEASLHRRFASAKRHGEWFEPTPELLNFIAELRAKESGHA